jgi:hypothetical protein
VATVSAASLYGNPGRYVSQFVQAVDRVVKDGYLLKADGKALKAQVVTNTTKTRE